MSKVVVPSGALRQTISIQVFNADKTLKEDRGVVNYWSRNPLKRLAWNVLKHWAWARKHLFAE